MADERRNHKRMDCYMIALQSKKFPEEDDFFGVVRNISPGGAMIETDYDLTVDRQVELTFIREDRNQIWHGQGKVVWIKHNDKKIQFGLEFTELVEEDWQEVLNEKE